MAGIVINRLNLNLKEHLREDDHYHIVNDKIWHFFFTRYDGIEFKRFGRKRNDDSDECIIEANLIKINVHYFPGQKDDEDDHVSVIYESRFTSVLELQERLSSIKSKNKDYIKLWKAPIPTDFEAFYRNNLCEFKKHRKIKLNAHLLKKKNVLVGELEFSMDDFLIVECRCQGGFIFEEIEKLEDDEHLNEAELDDVKDDLDDPTTLRFINCDLTKILKKSSN